MMQRPKQSWVGQLAGLERKRDDAPRTHYTFLNTGPAGYQAWRNDLIARGEAREGDRFVYYYWKSPDDAPRADGADGAAP
jgi:hypothetical protein